ncbi:uncharacterized protein LOC132393466 isoform X2 [Hypanus sabinus]|uniref:uncharacterized protein LOC132393466 isoform X2 n=1 Tax=Hypanus sabinus TaxID=79690 RepID=UPI0028C3E7C1|nr:uncharacterized protein LOC132393466 isoform X2 [Hypanus sabinus]
MPGEIILFTLVTVGSIVLYVQPGLVQTTERESYVKSSGQHPPKAGPQDVTDFSLDSENCTDYTAIRLFQINGNKTEGLLSTHLEECKINTTCWEFELSCTNATSSTCVTPQDQVEIKYFLGWMKFKVNTSEKGTDSSNCDYLDQFWNNWSWLTNMLSVSDANVHILCLNSSFGINLYPSFHFIFGLNQNFALVQFHQALRNFTDTNEFDIEVGAKVLYPCDEQSESVFMYYETGGTWNSIMFPEVIQSTDSSSTSAHSEISSQPVTLNLSGNPQSMSQLEESRETTVPTEGPKWWGMTSGTAASNRTEAAFTAFRGSLSITNWTFCDDLINKTSINYRKLENILMAQLPQLLTEAAEVILNRALEFTVVVEEFSKDSLIVNLILLTHLVKNVNLASMNSVLSAVNHLQSFKGCLLKLYGNIEDFVPCGNNICVYNCNVTNGMNKCTCLNALNGDRFICMPDDTSSCEGTQVVIPGPLAVDLEKMAQLLDFANNTGCSFNRSTAGTSGTLHVRGLCLDITDGVTDLWLDWKNNEVLHLVLEGPNITVCQFSVPPKEQMTFKLIDSTDRFKGSFLVGYTQLNKEKSHASEKFESLTGNWMNHRKTLAVYTNESLSVNVSIQTRLASNPKLFLKSCEVVSAYQDSERTKLIEDGCPMVNGLSNFLNGNSSFVLLSVNSSIPKNFTVLICKLLICAANHCGCSRNKLQKYFGPNSNSLQENFVEIGPIVVMERTAEDKNKNDELHMMMVIFITIGSILLVIMIISILRFIYRRVSDAMYTARVFKKMRFLKRQSSMDPISLISWKQL